MRVLVRARPLLDSEKAKNQTEVVRCPDPKTVAVSLPSTEIPGQSVTRTFDFALACHSGFDQAAVYEHCGVTQFVDMALEGFPATILAYGCTGSGKTYTMSGHEQSSSAERGSDAGAHDGIIPRACRCERMNE